MSVLFKSRRSCRTEKSQDLKCQSVKTEQEIVKVGTERS